MTVVAEEFEKCDNARAMVEKYKKAAANSTQHNESLVVLFSQCMIWDHKNSILLYLEFQVHGVPFYYLRLRDKIEKQMQETNRACLVICIHQHHQTLGVTKPIDCTTGSGAAR